MLLIRCLHPCLHPFVTPGTDHLLASRHWAFIVMDNELRHAHMADHQAIVLPEIIDVIRAVTGAECGAGASIVNTGATMGIGVL